MLGVIVNYVRTLCKQLPVLVHRGRAAVQSRHFRGLETHSKMQRQPDHRLGVSDLTRSNQIRDLRSVDVRE